MILFDVRCRVLEPIQVTDKGGHDITLAPGYYRLRGLDHLVKSAAGLVASTGMDVTLIDENDGAVSYRLTQQKLAELLVDDDVEVTI